jgi:hypothetical protein
MNTLPKLRNRRFRYRSCTPSSASVPNLMLLSAWLCRMSSAAHGARFVIRHERSARLHLAYVAIVMHRHHP